MSRQEDKSALPAGSVVGGYRLLGVLGVGGFGVTYQAEDRLYGQEGDPYAIKEYLPNQFAMREGATVYPRSAATQEDFEWGLARFEEEARVLMRFNHRHIVRVRQFIEANNTAYIVMLYEDGAPLDELLRRHRRLTEGQLRGVLLPIADGLREVHAEGVLHRDIKPANVFVRRSDSSPVLLDFGAARTALGAHSQSMDAVVSPPYSPTEQYDSGSTQGPYTDIYALSALCYRAITGVLPTEAPRRLTELYEGRADPVSSLADAQPSGYSEGILRAVDWGLMPRAGDRPQGVEEWLAAIENRRPCETEDSTPSMKTVIRPQTARRNDRTGNAQPKKSRMRFVAWFSLGLIVVGMVAPTGVDSEGRTSLLAQLYKHVWDGKQPADVPALPHLPNDQGRPGPETDGDHIDAGARPDPGIDSPPQTAPNVRKSAKGPGYPGWPGYPLTVQTSPPDARIQIMNIGPKYRPGMRLPPGHYEVKVSAKGFETVELTLEHGRDMETTRWIGLPFRDCPICPTMVELPTGKYTMGTARTGDEFAQERPTHEVAILSSLAVGVFEVSFAEYDACMSDGGCSRTIEDNGRGRGHYPAVNASVGDAESYTSWLSVRTDRKYRLLSEAEWEWAARAGTTSDQHWSPQHVQCAYENGADTSARRHYGDLPVASCTDGFVHAAPAKDGRFKPNLWGLYHMLGNASEWTRDCWHGDYKGAPTDGSAWMQGCTSGYVVRGGSWRSAPDDLRAGKRFELYPRTRRNDVGFRVAVEVDR